MADGSRSFAPPLEQALAYPVRVKILGALAEATEPITPDAIQQHADIAKSSFYEHYDSLEDLNLVETTQDNHIQLTDSQGADAAIKLNQFLGDRYAEQGEVQDEITDLLK